MKPYTQLAYIAGPYRAATEWDVEHNIRKAEEVALAFWQFGYATICPHKNCAHFGGTLPDKAWLKGDLEMIRRCDVVVMLPGWKDSEGAKAEHELARELHKTIVYHVESGK